ncbi:MAG: amidohydrolase family protein [Paracoccaceae bacterium]|nr:amidohydrolase family protein [Paracoccaceae bacterium]
MSDDTAPIRITNCHIHTFTTRHIPRWYPSVFVALLGHVPNLLALWAHAISLILPERGAAAFRLLSFQREAHRGRQGRIFDELRKQYPKDTRFVVLPMDMARMGYGPVRDGLDRQHEELLEVAAENEGQVIPFATVHPDRDDAAQRVERYLDAGCKGLKIYPRLGYAPSHPTLMERVYPMLRERDLPVMSHCSRGGVSERGLSRQAGDRLCAPKAALEVLKTYPDLRFCLAHFGGQDDWMDYVKGRVDPRHPDVDDANWLSAIRRAIGSGDWPGLWTDISYTMFYYDDFTPFLKMFIMGHDPWAARLRERVLFGSDFYMTRNTAMSEREVSVKLRLTLGEDLYRQIAEANPDLWLGAAAR